MLQRHLIYRKEFPKHSLKHKDDYRFPRCVLHCGVLGSIHLRLVRPFSLEARANLQRFFSILKHIPVRKIKKCQDKKSSIITGAWALGEKFLHPLFDAADTSREKTGIIQQMTAHIHRIIIFPPRFVIAVKMGLCFLLQNGKQCLDRCRERDIYNYNISYYREETYGIYRTCRSFTDKAITMREAAVLVSDMHTCRMRWRRKCCCLSFASS